MRRRLSKKASRKLFRNTAKRIKSKNLRRHAQRGGYAL